MKQRYPYQNLGLANIKGERWMDIPGFELYFKVSNYGRIKRLEYEQQYSDGRIYTRPAKTIKPVVIVIHNEFMNDNILFLRATITLHKRKYNYSLSRLVYYCFKESFDMEDESIVILTKDSNGLNIRLSNLKKTTRSERQKRMSAVVGESLQSSPPSCFQQTAYAASRKCKSQQNKSHPLVTSYILSIPAPLPNSRLDERYGQAKKKAGAKYQNHS